MIYLEVTEASEIATLRERLVVKQANLPPNETIGVELCIPDRPQAQWDVFFAGLPHASVLVPDCAQLSLARVRVTDEADARAAWFILKPWFDGLQVRVQLHEHNIDAPCEMRDFDPEPQP